MANHLNEHILTRKGCPIHYWEGGAPNRPLVIFTHGACVDHRSFDQQVPAVINEYRVLTWDVRGQGLSQPVGEPFTVPLAVEDLLAIMAEMGYARAVFVGHSNGTYISQEMTFEHPDVVTALVIADGTCITWKHSAFDNWLVKISASLMAPFPFETLKKSSLSYGSARKDVQDYTYAAYSMLSKHDFIEIWKGVSTCLRYEPDYHVTQPMLLVHGAEDKMGDIAKLAPLWAASEPNCQYAVIPDARHFAILDNPAAFNQLLLPFLSKWTH